MNTSTPVGRAAVVYESMFGNTAAIAAAVAEGLRQAGLRVVTTDVAATPPTNELEVDLLVLGAPTHAFSLSRPRTRADAVNQGADRGRAATGLREWISAAPTGPSGAVVATFDTRVDKVRRLPFGAARTAATLARRRGLKLAGRPTGFFVTETKGPLAAGELDRAVTWGRELGTQLSGPAGASRASRETPKARGARPPGGRG